MLRIFHCGKLFMKIPLTRTNFYKACVDHNFSHHVFVFAFFQTVTYIVDISWFLQTPTMISLIPFDNTAHTLATGPIYEKTLQTITWTQ